jgi:hypothetical protein
MRRWWPVLGCVGVAWLGACGASDEALSAACTQRDGVQRALEHAPRAVRLADGTRLSQCIEHAATSADLQNVGSTLTMIAEDLEARAASDPAAAVRLGYLIGAARRGAGRSAGQGAELAHRLERSGAQVTEPAAADALMRGLRTGEGSG